MENETDVREDAAKNSPLRVLTKPFSPAARWLEQSGVRANTVTLAGMGLTVAGGALATAGWGHGIPEILTVAGGTADVMDGQVARHENARGRSEKAQADGKLFDVTCDRLGALAVAVMRAEAARQRGDVVGKYAALANGVAQNLPSLVRAAAEMNGQTVSELDLGSYPVRWVLAFAATHFPTEGGYEIQRYADLLSTVLAVITTGVRLQSLVRGRGEPVSDIERLEAPAKFWRLLGITTLAVATVIAYEAATESS
jgi:phosphatidylglycerophosphate synthase